MPQFNPSGSNSLKLASFGEWIPAVRYPANCCGEVY